MRRGASLAVLGMLGLADCIIPDRDIMFEGGPANPGPVRIVEPTVLLPEFFQICATTPLRQVDAGFCPYVPLQTLRSGLLRHPDGPFCVCPDGDARAVESFEIIAEDPDIDDGIASDVIYGVALLDADPLSERPYTAVAYENYWQPCAPGYGPVANDLAGTEREAPFAWTFRFDDASGRGIVDLCNDNNGQPLAPGLHTLQFMVSDRPFFSPLLPAPDGGDPRPGPQQCGVPDLAAGATYSVSTYVFECRAEADDPACDCEEPDDG